MRGSAVVARWSHKPEVAGSSPVPVPTPAQHISMTDGVAYRPGSATATTLGRVFATQSDDDDVWARETRRMIEDHQMGWLEGCGTG